MNTNDFAYWLHGWSEINGGAAPTPAQWVIINDHLNLVFNKVTPRREITSTDFITTGITPLSGDMSWYPESLRKHNRENPHNILYC